VITGRAIVPARGPEPGVGGARRARSGPAGAPRAPSVGV